MTRRIPRVVLVLLLWALSFPARAQQPASVPRIGYLSGGSFPAVAARVDAFRQGLRDLGYVEGKNLAIDWREANGDFDRARELAAELVRLNVDVLVSPGPAATRVLKEATLTIPIVMAQDTDPVGSGFAVSLARPGGNFCRQDFERRQTGGFAYRTTDEIRVDHQPQSRQTDPRDDSTEGVGAGGSGDSMKFGTRNEATGNSRSKTA